MSTNTIKASTIGLLLGKNIGTKHRSEWYRGTICNNRTEGYEVSTAGNSICISFHVRTTFTFASAPNEAAWARIAELRERIVALLTERGYNVEHIDEQLWEPHPSANFGYYRPGDLRITREAK